MTDILTLSQRLERKLEPKPWYIQLLRSLLIWVINVAAIQIAIALMPGVTTSTGWGGIFVFAALIAILNASIRPFLVKFTLPITMATLGLITLVINGGIFLLAGWLFPVIQFNSFWQAIWLSIVVTLITWLMHVILSVDDSDSYYYSVVKRMGLKRQEESKHSDTPGHFYFEIDGLSRPILQKALAAGAMPTLQQLLNETHTVLEWETDLATQTCSSQLGILHGNNKNAVGFRWYDRAKQKMFTASNPRFVAAHEAEISDGKGLLSNNGASIGNMFTGDATITAFTTSASGRKDKTNPYDPLSYYFINPFNYVHTLAMVIWEVILEFRDFKLQEKEQREPRVHRGWESAIMRAFMCIIVPDIAIQTAIGELYSGRDTIYMTYAGYDELSHLSGLDRPEVMRGLNRADRALFFLLLAMKESPRPYNLVILSDHGQTMGWTFKHEYGTAFADVVKNACKPDSDMREMAGVDEVGIVVGDILSDIRKSFRSKISLDIFRKVTGFFSKTVESDDDVFVVDTTARKQPNKQEQVSASGFDDLPEILLQTGGNIGMIYFTKEKKQLDLAQISEREPKLIPTIAAHPGVSIVMVASAHGPLVIGKKGKKYLDWDGTGTEKIVGSEPLWMYTSNAARHLRRVAKYTTCPEILVLSKYDPETEQVLGFEPQCGAHGALGGPQNRPFLAYPRKFKLASKDKIIGAENIHRQLMQWQKAS